MSFMVFLAHPEHPEEIEVYTANEGLIFVLQYFSLINRFNISTRLLLQALVATTVFDDAMLRLVGADCHF